MSQSHTPKEAVVYRMVMPEHTCPYGIKVVHLLKTHGFTVIDKPLKTHAEVEAFKAEHEVKTTPQTFIDGERIGGYDDLRRYLGYTVADPSSTSYRPVIVIFAVALLLAVAVGFITNWSLGTEMLIMHFLSISMVLLALMKLRDVEGFSTMFLNYDVLARRVVPYGYVYPYAELAAGILMFAGILHVISIPIALFIGSVGAWSVFKAVYIEKRELKCACVGGDTKVPLGFVSLTENLMMVGMGLYMLGSMVHL